MPAITQALRDAQTLADFSNLEPSQADYFRNNYPDFAPEGWWDYQFALQDVMLVGDLEHLKMLLNDPFWNREPFKPRNPEAGTTYAFRQQTTERKLWQLNQSWLKEAWKLRFRIELIDILKLLTSVFVPRKSMAQVFGTLLEVPIRGTYHRGVSFLLEQKWRVRFCQECGKRFVAGESRTRYCSETCSHNARIRQERESWRKNGKRWRKKRFTSHK